MKWILWAAAALLVLFLLFTEELYRYVFCRKSSWLFCRLFDSKGHSEDYYAWRQQGTDYMKTAEQKVFTMKSPRGELLKGFYYPNGSQGKTIALVVHGYRSDHCDTGALCCRYYKSRGIDVFAMDHTASGDSEGRFIGFDVYESQDCLQWLEVLREKFGPDVKFILHGFSMGAATVMQMSSQCPENVKFIVEDSGYRDAEAAMRHQVYFMFTPLRLLNRWIGGYDWLAADVTGSLSRSRIPMLFVHGQEDKLVPYENGPALYDLYQGPKDCLFPGNTRHVESMFTSPEAYGEKLDSFLQKYL